MTPVAVRDRDRTLPSFQRATLRDRCRSVFDRDADPPETFSKREATEVRLLSHWTYAHRDEIAAVRWAPNPSPEALAEAVEATLAAHAEPAA